jgi:PhnB protein
MTDLRSTDEPRLVPYLYYEDVEAALKWLTDAFGFRERDHETLRSPNGTIVHAAMDLDGSRIMLGSPGGGYQNPKHLGQATQNLYVHVDDLNAHFVQAKRAGAKLITEIEDAFYGDRRYGAEDLEGHEWYFAQTVRDIAPKDWKPTARDLGGH